MIIITSGKEYIDIDAYASILAYRELLKLQGEDAIAVSSASPNESVIPAARNMKNVALDSPANLDGARFIILDLSDSAYFDPIVDPTKVVEIIDHHPGHETAWQNTDVKTTIEPIGSVATLIYEKYQAAGKLGQMKKEIAELLMMAILDNALNFQARITTPRDRLAYRNLARIAGVVGTEFAKNYFLACEQSIKRDLKKAVQNDTKTGQVSTLLPRVFGQLALWDGGWALANSETIREALDSFGPHWLINIISLRDGASYLLASDNQTLKTIADLFGVEPAEVIKLSHVWLRKEIVKKALENEPASAER